VFAVDPPPRRSFVTGYFPPTGSTISFFRTFFSPRPGAPDYRTYQMEISLFI